MKNDATGKTIIEETKIETSNTTDKNIKIPDQAEKSKSKQSEQIHNKQQPKTEKWAEWSEATNSAYQPSLPDNHNITEWAIVEPKGKTLPDKEIITEEILETQTIPSQKKR